VNSDAREIVAAHLAFARVHSNTHLDAQPPHGLRDGDPASHRPSRPVERCEEPDP
jgi:hypothetical protein